MEFLNRRIVQYIRNPILSFRCVSRCIPSPWNCWSGSEYDCAERWLLGEVIELLMLAASGTLGVPIRQQASFAFDRFHVWAMMKFLLLDAVGSSRDRHIVQGVMAAERGHHDAARCRLYYGICREYFLRIILYKEVTSLTVFGRQRLITRVFLVRM